MIETILMLLVFVILIIIGVPIAFSMGLSSLFYAFLKGKTALYYLISQKIFVGMDNFVLICIPLFIFSGMIMNESGITKRLIKFSLSLVGNLKGGLAHVNIVTSMFFAGMTGASTADTAAIGSILIPAMQKEGYDLEFSTGVTVGSSTIGAIIPPSIAMVTFSVMSGASIAKLFLAGFIPGALVGFVQMIIAYVFAVRRNYPTGEKTSFKKILSNFYDAFFAIIMPLIIVFGMVFGVFSPTEAAAIAVLYSLFVGLVVYKELDIKKIPALIFSSSRIAGGILLMISMATAFGWIMSTENIPRIFASYLMMLENKYLILIAINLILLFMGTFLEPQAIIILMTPMLLPIAQEIGMSLTNLGIMVVLNVTLGLLTPPVGMCLYVASGLTGLAPEKVAKAAMPFFLGAMLVLILVTFVPSITEFIPSLVFR